MRIAKMEMNRRGCIITSLKPKELTKKGATLLRRTKKNRAERDCMPTGVTARCATCPEFLKNHLKSAIRTKSRGFLLFCKTTTARATAATIQDLKFEYLPIFLICDYHLLGQSNVEVIQGLCTLVALLLLVSCPIQKKATPRVRMCCVLFQICADVRALQLIVLSERLYSRGYTRQIYSWWFAIAFH